MFVILLQLINSDTTTIQRIQGKQTLTFNRCFQHKPNYTTFIITKMKNYFYEFPRTLMKGQSIIVPVLWIQSDALTNTLSTAKVTWFIHSRTILILVDHYRFNYALFLHSIFKSINLVLTMKHMKEQYYWQGYWLIW